MAITKVTTEVITTSAVTTPKIADNAITAAKIPDGTIATGHIADNAVTAAKIPDNVLTATMLPDNVITATHIPNSLIVTAHIADNAITAAKLPDNVLTATMLPDNVILATHIPNATNLTLGTVTAALTGNASGTAATVTGAAQTNITSLGTLTSLAVGAITSTAGATITTADNTDNLAIVSTDADANTGPNISFWRNSSSPADGDHIGQINWYAENDADEKTHIAQIAVKIEDVTDGTEDARFILQTIVAGAAETSRVELLPTETVINQDSKDLDFRVESNNKTHMLFVDGGTDNVGIGTTPADAGSTTRLHIADAASTAILQLTGAGVGTGASDGFQVAADDNGDAYLRNYESGKMLFYTNAAEKMRIEASGDVGIGTSQPKHPLHVYLTNGELAMFGSNQMNSVGQYAGIGLGQVLANNTTYQKVAIVAEGRDSGSYVSNLHFLVDTAGDGNSAVLSDSKMTISGANGYVGIGTTAPNALLTVGDTSNSNTELQILSSTSGNGYLYWGDGTSGASRYSGYIGYYHNGNYMALSTSATQRLRIDSDGLKFNADTAAANALDDYEEGTWTPTMASDAGAAAYTTQVGTYTKIGRLVNVTCEVKISDMGSMTGGTVNLAGLPFTVKNLDNNHPIGAIQINGAATATDNSFWRLFINTTYGRMEARSGATSTDNNQNANVWDTGTTTRATVTYFTDA